MSSPQLLIILEVPSFAEQAEPVPTITPEFSNTLCKISALIPGKERDKMYGEEFSEETLNLLLEEMVQDFSNTLNLNLMHDSEKQ